MSAFGIDFRAGRIDVAALSRWCRTPRVSQDPVTYACPVERPRPAGIGGELLVCALFLGFLFFTVIGWHMLAVYLGG